MSVLQNNEYVNRSFLYIHICACVMYMDMVLLERVPYTNTQFYEWNTSSHILRC